MTTPPDDGPHESCPQPLLDPAVIVAHYEKHEAGGGSVSHGALRELCALARLGLQAEQWKNAADLANAGERARSAQLAEVTAERDALQQRISVLTARVLRVESGRTEPTEWIDVVFDGPPAHESGRFVEVEDQHGHGRSAGRWIEPTMDKFWRLRLTVDDFGTRAEGHPVSWTEVTRQLGERVARLEATSRLLDVKTAIVAMPEVPRAVTLDPQVAAGLNEVKHEPTSKPGLSFADIGKSPAFKCMADEHTAREVFGDAILANWLMNGDKLVQRTDGTTIAISVAHWQNVWSPLIGAVPPLDLQACVDRLIAQNEAGEREAAQTVDSLRAELADFERAIKNISDAHWQGVELYREAGGAVPGDLPPVRAELVRWLLTRLEDEQRERASEVANIKHASNHTIQELQSNLARVQRDIQLAQHDREQAEQDATKKLCKALFIADTATLTFAVETAVETLGAMPRRDPGRFAADLAAQMEERDAKLASGLAPLPDPGLKSLCGPLTVPRLASEQILRDVINAVLADKLIPPPADVFEVRHRPATPTQPPRAELHVHAGKGPLVPGHVLAYVELGVLWIVALDGVGGYVMAHLLAGHLCLAERVQAALARK